MRRSPNLANPIKHRRDPERWLCGLLLAAALARPARADAAVCGGYDDCLHRMTQAAETKDYATAQAAAEAALAMRPDPVLLLNLGTFHERQQHSAEALDFYERYLKNPGPELTPERHEKLERRVAALRQTIPPPNRPGPSEPKVAERKPPPPPPPQPPPPQPPPPQPAGGRLGLRTYVGLPLAALGLGLFGTGAAVLAAEGRCVDEAQPCKEVYQGNLGIGLGLLLPGAAAVVAGVTLFSLDLVHRRKVRLSVLPLHPQLTLGRNRDGDRQVVGFVD